MKIITANRLSDGRVIYLGEVGLPVEGLDQAGLFNDLTAPQALEQATGNPAVFVNPYAVEVEVRDGGDGQTRLRHPSGRDRLKETIRSAGPTVGSSLKVRSSAPAGYA